MRKQRLPRVKVGRRLIAPPSVPSMTDPAPVAPKPEGGEPEKPTDEPSEELTRMIKSAYQ